MFIMKIISVRDIAVLVKQERKKCGWTQAELAMRSGVSRDWVIALEKGKPTLELGLVLRTVKALHIRIDAAGSVDTPLNYGSMDRSTNSGVPISTNIITGDSGKGERPINTLNDSENEYS